MRAWGAWGHARRRACEYKLQEGWEGTPEFYLGSEEKNAEPTPNSRMTAEPRA